MKFHEQSIADVRLIEPEPYRDARGQLRRHFCKNEFSKAGVEFDVKQTNVSENPAKLTLRGFHFQHPPHQEGKVLSCMKGALYDIVVDLRPASPTFLKWQSFELSDENRLCLYVPPGCANAYLTTVENTWIFYYHTEFYAPGDEGGIRYNDPYFKFAWPAEPAVISERDKNHPLFDPARLRR